MRAHRASRERAAGSTVFGEVRRGRSGEVQAAARVKGTRQPPRSGDGAVADGAAWSWSTTSRWRGAASRSGRRRASAVSEVAGSATGTQGRASGLALVPDPIQTETWERGGSGVVGGLGFREWGWPK